MKLTVDPRELVGQQLTPTAIAENDYRVLPAGRVFLREVANGASHWFWTLSGPSLVQPALSSSGQADTLEEARLALRTQFDKWLAWSLGADVAVYWQGALPSGE